MMVEIIIMIVILIVLMIMMKTHTNMVNLPF